MCWAAVNSSTPVLVADVHAFEDHISCDSMSLSEITVPVFNEQGDVTAVFDVDSDQVNAFTMVDQRALSEIMALIFSTE